MRSDQSNIQFFTDDAVRQIRRALDKGRNPEDLWNRIGERMSESIDHNFETGGRPDPWPALAWSTLIGLSRRTRKISSKDKLTFTRKFDAKTGLKNILGHKILVGRGRLRGSIAYRGDDKMFQIGSNLIYARIHQFGGEAGRKSHRVKIPKRPYLVFQEEDQRGIVEVDVPGWLEVGK